MDYQLALSSDLGLNASDFVSAWNEDPHLRSKAEARLSASASSTYFDPSLIGMAIDFAIGVGAGLTSTGLYEIIKKVLTKKGVRKHTQMIEQQQPDGSYLLVVTIDEQ